MLTLHRSECKRGGKSEAVLGTRWCTLDESSEASALKTQQRTQLGRQIAILWANSILKQMKPWLRRRWAEKCWHDSKVVAWRRGINRRTTFFRKPDDPSRAAAYFLTCPGHTGRAWSGDRVLYPSFSDTSLAHISSRDRRSSVKTKRIRGKTTGCLLYTQEGESAKLGDYFQQEKEY